MKRYRLVRRNALLAVGVVVALMGVYAPTAQARTNTNDFTIREYTINYTLSRDNEERSTLRTKETIIAQFPLRDQNHGIERYIPTSYDNHPTDLKIQSVTTRTGSAIPYQTRKDGAYTVVRIGDKNRYVQGEQSYVIEYTQRDVTKGFPEEDEFYWDTNGTQWKVPIDHLAVSLTLDPSISGAYTGQSTCYEGVYRSTAHCTLTQDGTTLTTQAWSLSPGYNLTVALGFRPQTFSGYEKSLLQILTDWWLIIQAVLMVVSIGCIVWLGIRYHRRANRTRELGTIVPEYVPPRDVSVQVSAKLLGATRELTAQLIDLAVRHYIQITEQAPKKMFRPAQYNFKIIRDVQGLSEEEREIIQDIFRSTRVGTTVSTKELRQDTGLGRRLENNPAKLTKLLKDTYKLRKKDPNQSKQFKHIGWTFLIIAIVLLSPPLMLVAIISFIMAETLQILTDKGLALLRYLKGLKMYISAAEADRLKMLQSPEGAEKTQLQNPDLGQLVRLYETLLPYAILFKQENEWNKQLGRYYESAGAQPDWYLGSPNTAFNAVMFSNSMSQLSSSISASGASSSTSGGASGGGYSGGGGGGGGGGGW